MNNSYELGVGERLKALRLATGNSQRQAALKIGLSYSTIRKYESGEFLPSALTLIDLADFYKTSVDYILGRVEEA